MPKSFTFVFTKKYWFSQEPQTYHQSKLTVVTLYFFVSAPEPTDGDECDGGAGFLFSGECCANDKVVWSSDFSMPVKCCRVTIPGDDAKCENQDLPTCKNENMPCTETTVCCGDLICGEKTHPMLGKSMKCTRNALKLLASI